ncbi:MAG: ATP-binding protein [Pseudomonadales bacterium]
MTSHILQWPDGVSAGALKLGEQQLNTHLAAIVFFAGLAALIGHAVLFWLFPERTFLALALMGHLALVLVALRWLRVGAPVASYRAVVLVYCYLAASVCFTAAFYDSPHSLLQYIPLNIASFYFLLDRRWLMLAQALGGTMFAAALVMLWNEPVLPQYLPAIVAAWVAGLALHTGRASVLEALHSAGLALRAETDERHKAEARALVSKKRESLGVMAGGVAHDFNNLLTTIVGGTELAALAENDRAAAGKALGTIRDAAQAAQDLCRSLLDYASGGAGERTAIDLNDVARDAVRLARPRLPAQTALIAERAGEPVWVRGNGPELRQAVVNLISNSIEAFDGEKGIIRVISDSTHYGRMKVQRLRVLDNGPGISSAAQERIFDPFFTTKPIGRGLGLASVAATMHAHNGQVDVESAAGGTAFELRLPPPAQDAAVQQPDIEAVHTAFAARLTAPSFQRLVRESRQEAQLDVLFATVFDQLPHLVMQKDLSNTTLRVNRAMATLRGVTADAMANTQTARWHPDEADAYYRDDQEVIRTGAPKLGIREQIELADGVKQEFVTDKVPTFAPDGTVTGVLVFSRRSEGAGDEIVLAEVGGLR